MYKITIKNLIDNTSYYGIFTTYQECIDWHNEKLIWHGNENANPPTAEVTIEFAKEELIAKLWQDCSTFAESQMDSNSRHSIDLLLASGTATPQQLQRIYEYGAWWQSLWGYYAVQKAKIVAGEVATFDASVVGNAPHDIWSIVA